MRPTNINYQWSTPFNYPGLHLDIDPTCYIGDKTCYSMVDSFLNDLTYTNPRDFIAENNVKHHSMGRHIQGVINLIDNREQDGGFQCVPMSDPSNWLKKWWLTKGDHKPNANGRYIFTKEDSKKLKGLLTPQRVPCKAGTLILVDASLPHGTKPNKSSRFRAIQFMRYVPQSIFSAKTLALRSKKITWQCVAAGFKINTDIKKQLLSSFHLRPN